MHRTRKSHATGADLIRRLQLPRSGCIGPAVTRTETKWGPRVRKVTRITGLPSRKRKTWCSVCGRTSHAEFFAKVCESNFQVFQVEKQKDARSVKQQARTLDFASDSRRKGNLCGKSVAAVLSTDFSLKIRKKLMSKSNTLNFLVLQEGKSDRCCT